MRWMSIWIASITVRHFLGIRLTQSKAEMGALLTEMVEKVDCGEQFVYWQVTRGTAMRNHAYPDPDKVPANLWIVLTPCSVQDTYKKSI